MKHVTIALATVAALALSPVAFSQTTSGRTVTVDLNRIFNDYYKTPASSAKLKDVAETYNREQEELLAQFRKLSDDLSKLQEDQDKPEYTEEVRAQKRKAVRDKLEEIKAKEREIQEYRRGHTEMLQQQTQRMRQGILKEIQEVIAKEARDLGYLYVLDKSGTTLNGIPTIIYSQESLDITDDILKILNRNAPKTTPESGKTDKKPADDKKK